MSIDIPAYSQVLFVGDYSEIGDGEGQVVFLNSKCPMIEGKILYLTVDDKIISKGCYDNKNDKLTIIWIDTDLNEPAPEIKEMASIPLET